MSYGLAMEKQQQLQLKQQQCYIATVEMLAHAASSGKLRPDECMNDD